MPAWTICVHRCHQMNRRLHEIAQMSHCPCAAIVAHHLCWVLDGTFVMHMASVLNKFTMQRNELNNWKWPWWCMSVCSWSMNGIRCAKCDGCIQFSHVRRSKFDVAREYLLQHFASPRPSLWIVLDARCIIDFIVFPSQSHLCLDRPVVNCA